MYLAEDPKQKEKKAASISIQRAAQAYLFRVKGRDARAVSRVAWEHIADVTLRLKKVSPYVFSFCISFSLSFPHLFFIFLFPFLFLFLFLFLASKLSLFNTLLWLNKLSQLNVENEIQLNLTSLFVNLEFEAKVSFSFGDRESYATRTVITSHLLFLVLSLLC